MQVIDVIEGVVPIWSKTGGKVKRKYRCTSGPKQGRIVAKVQTCNTPVNISKSRNLAQTKAKKGQSISIKTKRTKKYSAASRTAQGYNLANRRNRSSVR